MIGSRVSALLIAGLCAACDGETVPVTNDPPPPPPPTGCAPGELALEDGSCQPAGVPEAECASGFVADGTRGCAPVLPEQNCADGTMAVPGDESCREVSPCGMDRWGDIPIEPGALHVDAAYTVGDGDGSPQKPFATIAAALLAAESGAQVVIAAGSYVEDLPPLFEPVRLWGKCPREVEIVGSASTFSVLELRAAGIEIHGVAVRGGGLGVTVVGDRDVVLERVWIHDTGDRGLEITDFGTSTSAVLRDSLVEAATGLAAYAYGAELTIERSQLRETARYAAEYVSLGIGVFDSLDTGVPAVLSLRSSVVESSPESGVLVFGSNATIEASVVQSTLPNLSGGFGQGVMVQSNPDTGAPAMGNISASVIQSNLSAGVSVLGARVDMNAVTVRDTELDPAEQLHGTGLEVQSRPEARASVKVRASLFERNKGIGAYVGGADVTLEGVIVRDTRARGDGYLGVGVGVDTIDTGRGALIMKGSLVARNEAGGIYVSGGDALVEGTLVRDSLAEPASLKFGRGIQIQDKDGSRANVTVRDALVERNRDVGVNAAGSDLRVERTTIRDTAPRDLDNNFGDGLVLFGVNVPTSAIVEAVRIENSARAGVLAFSATVSIGASVLECNLINLDGESMGPPYELVATSPNVCGCDGEVVECKVLSSMLEPPDAF
jgi:hypothetical protein